MNRILEMHFQKYPLMEIQDAVKLIFQSEFGPGHLIENTEAAKKWLIKEMEETKDVQPEIIELSDDLVRLHLGHMSEKHAELILDAMIETAHEVKGSMEKLYQKLDILKEMNHYSLNEIDDYLHQYLNGISLIVSHTDKYRDLYHPHYRVLKKELAEKVINELHQ